MAGKKIGDLDVYDDVNIDKSRRNLYEVSKNSGTYTSPTYATDGSRKITQEQLKEELFIKEISSYNLVTTGSPNFQKQAYNGIANTGTYTLPTSTGKYEVLSIIIEGSISVTVNGLGGGYGDLVFTNQNETAFLIDTVYGWYPLAVNKEINTSTFELLSNKVSSVVGNEADTTKYTNTKAVADYITFFYTNGVIPAIEGHIVDLVVQPNSVINAPTTASITTALNLKANLASPTFTGTPLAPTATSGTNTTQIATTAFVTSAIGAIPTPPTPTLATVTTAGNTTTSSITVGGLVVDMPTGSGVATSITKGGAGEALTVNKTSGSGNVASFTGGKTLISELDLTTALADSEIASASTWNDKLGLSGGTLTGALNEAPIITLASASNVDIVNIAGNTAYITGTTGISTFTAGTSGMVRRVQFAGILVLAGGNNIRLANNAATITTSAKDVGTFIYNSADSLWYCVSYVRGTAIGLTANRFTYYNGTDIVTTNHIIGNDGNNITWVNDSFQTFGSGLNYIRGGTTAGLEISSQANRKVQIMCGTTSRIRVEGNDILLGGGDHYFQSYAGTQYGRLNSNGLLVGTGTINSACALEIANTTKGVGLSLVANGSKPTGKKGNFLMNDTNSVLEFTTGTGANWQEIAVYKFDELLQISDCLNIFNTANTGVYFPFNPKCDMNVTKIYYNLQSAGTDTVRVAIYSDVSNIPTTLIAQSNEATTGATTLGQRSITIASTRLLAGTRYWIAIKNDNGAVGFLNKNNVYSNNITREGFQSGDFVGNPAPSSSVNAVWLAIGI